MPDVFISYNREDREVAHAVAAGLEAEGFSVWWDAALRAGEYYEEVTEKNLRAAAAVVVLWSKRSTESKWVRAEATVGERSSSLVPALIEECDRPVRFELLQTADLTRWKGDRTDANWRGFVRDVREAIARRRSVAAAAPQGEAPAPNQRSNMEATFWSSIKDGRDRADFEAYLARYPGGHFADLARNRIAAIDRAGKPTHVPTARPTEPVARSPQPAPAKPAARAPVAPPPVKSSGSAILIASAAAALAAAVVVGFFVMRKGAEPKELAAAKTPSSQSPSRATPIPEAPPTEVSLPEARSPGASIAENGTPDAPVVADAARDAAQSGEVAASSESSVAAAGTAPAEGPSAGSSASGKDCDECPLMVTLPGGTFLMGSPESENGRNPYEGPQHEVTVKPFRMSVHEVTAGEWSACAAAGACAPKPAADQNLPILRVSWREANAYAKWLSEKTGQSYRLPTESEWEYAARGGTAGAWWWGERFEPNRLARGEVKPVGSFEANPFGLHDMLSNAREWVADCYVNNFTQTPIDGSAATGGDCSMRVIRGGAWSSPPADTRVANRSRIAVDGKPLYMGFRLAADIG